MGRKNPNKKYLNKLHSIKIIGKGAKGNFFGKIDGIVCFITTENAKLTYENVVDVKVSSISEKCLFAELVS